MLTQEEAKNAHLDKQMLLIRGNKSVIDIVKTLGHIQLDTISVVARTQDLVLHTRKSKYRELDIWKELKKGKLIEGWAHARSLVPKNEFPYQYGECLRQREKQPWWWKDLSKPEQWPKQVLKQIKDDGPVRTNDIVTPKGFPAGSPGWNTSGKRILDYLFYRGYIMVKERVKFQPYFDLTENVIDIPEDIPDKLEIFWNGVKSTLKSIGPAPIDRVLKYRFLQKSFEYGDKRLKPRELIRSAIKKGELSEIDIEGIDKKWITLPDYEMDVVQEYEAEVRLLSPFDSSLWPRESLLSQYDYNYKFEAYTPKVKRIYGFFSLPILYGNKFVGRVDPKLDRKSKIMNLMSWHWEDKFVTDTDFEYQLAQTINHFIDFHGAEKVNLGNIRFKNKITGYLDNVTIE